MSAALTTGLAMRDAENQLRNVARRHAYRHRLVLFLATRIIQAVDRDRGAGFATLFCETDLFLRIHYGRREKGIEFRARLAKGLPLASSPSIKTIRINTDPDGIKTAEVVEIIEEINTVATCDRT